MRVPSDHVLALTNALRYPDTVQAALAELRGATGKAQVEGMVELLYNSPPARVAIAAIEALGEAKQPIVVDSLLHALGSEHNSVRLEAIRAFTPGSQAGAWEPEWGKRCTKDLLRLLRTDSSWMVRRAVVRTLADMNGPGYWEILIAGNDPHWRVRHALIRTLLRWGKAPEWRQEIEQRLSAFDDPRIEGVLAYLRFRWTSGEPERPPLPAKNLCSSATFWDWDPAVLLRNLERCDDTNFAEVVNAAPDLLDHSDERVRAVAVDILRRHGEVEHLANALEWVGMLRNDAAADVQRLLSYLDHDAKEETARFILHMAYPSFPQLAWAIDQGGPAFPIEEEETVLQELMQAPPPRMPVRCALARLAARWDHPRAGQWLQGFLRDPENSVQVETLRGVNACRQSVDHDLLVEFLSSPFSDLRREAVTAAVRQRMDVASLKDLLNDDDAEVRLRLAEELATSDIPLSQELLDRLQYDPHPHVRAAAMTPDRAGELLNEPTRETSWHVLAEAARMKRVPLWHLEPEPLWQPPAQRGDSAHTMLMSLPRDRGGKADSSFMEEKKHLYVPLGPAKIHVSRMAISGAYGLPADGFVHAVDSGINLLFWEPAYHTMTDFFRRLSASDRRSLHLISGTFAADEQRIRRDVERALRQLRIERLDFFLLFWCRSRQRFAGEVGLILEKLQTEGKITTYGLSTHDRGLAVAAMEADWDPVMVRHNAAHRGAEQTILPRAAELGTSIITFNNTCYGRLLQPFADALPAADCYRYTLEQRGVSVCLSAPATQKQLEQNLFAWQEPELSEEKRHNLLLQAERVYREDTLFRKLVRGL